MKIIGDCGSDQVIVHMTKDEFAQMAGFHSSYSLGREGRPEAKPGSVLEVSRLYAQATELVRWYGEFVEDINKNHQRLTKLLAIIDPSKAPKI